jgi:restriction endonuclease S subunit
LNTINSTVVREFPIPLLSLEQQIKIVTTIQQMDSALEIIQEVKKKVSDFEGLLINEVFL